MIISGYSIFKRDNKIVCEYNIGGYISTVDLDPKDYKETVHKYNVYNEDNSYKEYTEYRYTPTDVKALKEKILDDFEKEKKNDKNYLDWAGKSVLGTTNIEIVSTFNKANCKILPDGRFVKIK